jgi:hypothetical protein
MDDSGTVHSLDPCQRGERRAGVPGIVPAREIPFLGGQQVRILFLLPWSRCTRLKANTATSGELPGRPTTSQFDMASPDARMRVL